MKIGAKMIKKIKLENNVELIMDKFESVSSVSIGIWSKTGANYETEGINGISHYIEHMLFKGTKNRSPVEIVSEVDKLGGQMNAFTGKEGTCFYIKCLGEHLFDCADVLVDMIENPLFDEKEMEREKKVVGEEIKMNFDDPMDLILDVTDEMVFGDSILGNNILGTMDTVNSFTKELVDEYYYNQYTKDSVFISIAGSFDEDAVIKYFSDKFKNLKKDKSVPKYIPYKYTPKKECFKKDIMQAHICFAKKGISAVEFDHYSLAIFNNLFGGSMSSRLFQNIREKRGLAYSVQSMSSYFRNDGYFKIYAGVNSDKIDETIEGIREELNKLNSGDISKEEIDSAREQLKSSYIFSLETVQGRMITNGRNNIQLDNVLSQENVLHNLDSVTYDDINKIIKNFNNLDEYSLAIIKGE